MMSCCPEQLQSLAVQLDCGEETRNNGDAKQGASIGVVLNIHSPCQLHILHEGGHLSKHCCMPHPTHAVFCTNSMCPSNRTPHVGKPASAHSSCMHRPCHSNRICRAGDVRPAHVTVYTAYAGALASQKAPLVCMQNMAVQLQLRCFRRLTWIRKRGYVRV